MASKKSDTKKTILVIGAGAGGAEAARAIAPKLDVASHEIIVVSPLPYQAILPATIRLAVTADGALEGLDKAFVPLDKLFPSGQPGRHVQGQVVSLTKADKGGEATLKSGEKIAFDILLLAMGSKWTGMP